MGTTNFRELLAWRQAMLVAKGIYAVIKKLPPEEKYVLGDQMRRAAVSVPSNIAEGQSRGSDKEFYHFLSIAQGSASELETQLLLAEGIGYFTNEDIQPILEQIQYLHAIIRKFQKQLEGKIKSKE